LWDAGSQHIVERGNAVSGYEEKALIIELIDVAHLAAGVELEVGEIGLQEYGIKKFRAHVLNFTG